MGLIFSQQWTSKTKQLQVIISIKIRTKKMVIEAEWRKETAIDWVVRESSMMREHLC